MEILFLIGLGYLIYKLVKFHQACKQPEKKEKTGHSIKDGMAGGGIAATFFLEEIVDESVVKLRNDERQGVLDGDFDRDIEDEEWCHSDISYDDFE